MLGLGMDEADEEEDEQISVNEVPFIASRDFLLKYGKNFDLHLDDAGQVILAALDACALPVRARARISC